MCVCVCVCVCVFVWGVWRGRRGGWVMKIYLDVVSRGGQYEKSLSCVQEVKCVGTILLIPMDSVVRNKRKQNL